MLLHLRTLQFLDIDEFLLFSVYLCRCGNIGGSQQEASWNQSDFTLLMLQGCLYTQTAPKIDWQVCRPCVPLVVVCVNFSSSFAAFCVILDSLIVKL
jgi:thioester reductase-like protein